MLKKAAFTLCVTLLLTLPALTAYASEDTDDSGLLWLVNRNHRVDSSYLPPGLVPVEGAFLLRAETVEAYRLMLAAMEADGITGLRVNSAYRTYADQSYIFNNLKTRLMQSGRNADDAAEIASRSIARPGTSEHQLGLAVDVTMDGTLTQAFSLTEASRWIEANGHLFGFIVRYQGHKTPITHIIYEPWHLRYVGMPHSAFMRENDMCYEEYVDYMKETRHYVYKDDKTYYAVMYLNGSGTEGFQDVVDISSVEPGVNSGYIVTMKKILPFIRLKTAHAAGDKARA